MPETPAIARERNIWHRLGLLVFVCILVFHGTYFRHRETVAVPTADWYVLLRLATCATALAVAVLLVPKNVRWGFGAKCTFLYVGAVWLSALKTPYPVTVVGYAILLSGASALSLALVYHARTPAQLEKIESVWFYTVAALVLKDSLTALFLMKPAAGASDRLGMGVTHATELSLFAALLFWISLNGSKRRPPALAWSWRAYLLYVIVAAKSRTSIAAFIAAGFCSYLVNMRDFRRRWLAASGAAFLVLLFLFALFVGQGWANDMSSYVKRGQDTKELTSVTGRTFIWRHVLGQVWKSPIIGNGYGVSRLTMGKVPEMIWEPPHCHNEMLEVMFNTGLLGLIPFLAMVLYSLKWMIDPPASQRLFTEGLARHAVCVVATLFISFMFEVRLSGRLSPFQPLFFFYMLALDREPYFRRLNAARLHEQHTACEPPACEADLQTVGAGTMNTRN